ncbi:MAG TPA: oligosaccharide flippase family protein, partial [Anaerolineae bacterium]|nr:oligosaccharide flippase family protein [Anaerolineae bacterium]
MSAKTVSKGILSVAAWNTVKIMASALSAPILARLLGTAGYGQYAYYLAIIAMAWPLANLGTAHIATKYIAERPDDFAWRSNLASFLGVVNLLAALLAGAIIASLLLASPEIGSDQLLLTIVVVGVIVLEQGLLFSRGVLYGLHCEELITLPAACGAIVAVVLGVILSLAGLGLLGVMVGLLIANLMVAVVTLRNVTQFVKWRFHPNLLRLLPVPGMLRFGLSSILYITLSLTLYRADVILIRHLSSDTQAGLYATAVQWSEFVWFIPMAVQAIMLQSTAPWWAGG